MSGFFGMMREDGRPVEERFLERIAEQLNFRGPDGRSVWAKANVGGCFTLMRTGPMNQASQQPVVWEDKFYLWGDLRLDGRPELLRQIAGNEHAEDVGATSEDLLLRAWAKWGEGCLERVIGDFSLALWDARERTLWCARDFVGARPFYYAHTRGVFCFSNTLTILRSIPEISGELDEMFVGDFLLDGWNNEPARTVYRDIRRVPAGHVLRFRADGVEVRRFRKLPIEEPLKLKQSEEYVENYLGLLKSAVNDRMPGGATALYLSGGLDSSSVCAVAAQIASERGQKEKLKAFTVSWEPFFDDPEPALATFTAKYLTIASEEFQEGELVLFERAESEAERFPEPSLELVFGRDRRFYRRIAAHSNVVLSGDGGDNVLTGQSWPYLIYLWRKGDWKEIVREFGGYILAHRHIPPLRGGFRNKVGSWLKKEDPLAGYPEWLNPEFAARTKLKQRWMELRNRKKSVEHTVHPRAYASLHGGYWADVLEAEDAGWIGERLETRAPLLDLRVLAFLLRLPAVPWCMNKELCRTAMRNRLPRAVVQRPKTPLRKDPLEVCKKNQKWVGNLPEAPPAGLERFVNWGKWCETFYHPKCSLSWEILRPVSLLHWLKAVEKMKSIQ
jgi:asparagine synthase (glutamine-hydrolysing)